MRFSNSLVRELASRLERIIERDEMTKEDADELLTGALLMNYKFFKLSGDLETPRDLVNAVRVRCNQILDEIKV